MQTPAEQTEHYRKLRRSFEYYDPTGNVKKIRRWLLTETFTPFEVQYALLDLVRNTAKLESGAKWGPILKRVEALPELEDRDDLSSELAEALFRATGASPIVYKLLDRALENAHEIDNLAYAARVEILDRALKIIVLLSEGKSIDAEAEILETRFGWFPKPRHPLLKELRDKLPRGSYGALRKALR